MTEAVRAELQSHDSDMTDGVFYMKIEDYFFDIDYTTVNYDTQNWHHDYFLQLNDVNGPAGSWGFCGAECKRYMVTVRNNSSVSNKIHAGAHMWRKRTYKQDGCETAFTQQNNNEHSIYRIGDNKITKFQGDENEKWLEPLEFAGNTEHTYIVELDLSRDEMSKDWSFTAWGENGAVQVTVNGVDTQHFPYITKNNDLLPEEGSNSGDQTANNAAANAAADNAETYAT